MMKHFSSSTEGLNKETCLNYATAQHNLILKAMKNKEIISDIKSISQNVIDKPLLQIYKNYHCITNSDRNNSDSKFHLIYSVCLLNAITLTSTISLLDANVLAGNGKDDETAAVPICVRDDANTALQTEINVFVLRKLPSCITNAYFRPHDVTLFLLKFKRVKIMGQRVSRKQLMQHMIAYQYVPVRLTSLYKIVRKLKLKDLPSDTSWTELSRKGCKPFISNRALQQLINDIKMSTDGGIAMSTGDIRGMVKEHIKEEWFARGQLNFLPEIHMNTLNGYTNIIKSQSIFNIHGSVSNKTQARAAAEWSMRSTISYAMAVSCSHFLPDVSATKFHPKKKDLSKESLELWNGVKLEYNKMFGNSETRVKLQPVLPNLVTSTDEVTIFATSSVLHGKESFYLVSKPDYIKMKLLIVLQGTTTRSAQQEMHIAVVCALS